MSSFALRALALFFMLLDHAGLSLFPSLGILRCAGRLAFPLYCFLLAEGFAHTKDVRAYMRRLLLAAIFSEIPFDLLIFGRLASPVEQNVLFSLFLALLALYAADALRARPMQAMLVCAGLAVCAMALRLSFGWLCVALVMCFYFSRENKARMLLLSSSALALYALSLLLSGVDTRWALTAFCALLALPLILLYNGAPGPRGTWLSFAFYAAYPAHLLLLVWLRALRIVPPYFLN